MEILLLETPSQYAYFLQLMRINGEVMKSKYKTRLNLTVNKKLIPNSDIYASLDSETNGFNSKWLGKFSVNHENDARVDNLKRRYSL